jgi:hypothetical protein
MQPPSTPLPRVPLGLALILARTVSFDVDTGVLSIVGPYSDVTTESFPVTYLSLEAYAVLTECDGDVLVELRLVDALEARLPVFRQLQSAHFDGPQDVRELVFHAFNVTIPAEGEYRLQLYVHGPSGTLAQGSFVLERRLRIRQAP